MGKGKALASMALRQESIPEPAAWAAAQERFEETRPLDRWGQYCGDTWMEDTVYLVL